MMNAMGTFTIPDPLPICRHCKQSFIPKTPQHTKVCRAKDCRKKNRDLAHKKHRDLFKRAIRAQGEQS